VVCITYPTRRAHFAAALSGCAAVLLWPVLLGFICPIFLVYLGIHWRRLPGSQRPAWALRHFLALALGGAAAFLAFLAMIGFEWSLFLHDFTRVASMRRPEGNSILQAFLGLSWARYNHVFLFSVLLLSIFSVYWALRPATILPPPTRLWVLETLAGCFLATLLYAVNTQLIYFFFWMAFFAVAADFVRLKARLELVLIALFSAGLWIQTFYSVKNLLPYSIPETTKAAEALKKHPSATVVFDEIAYRYLFDLQPPPESLAWLCLRPGPDLGASLADKKPDQIWVLAEKRLDPDGKSGSNDLVVIP
jgi:MFS family permease